MKSDRGAVFLVGAYHCIQFTNVHSGPEALERIQEFEDYLALLAIDNDAVLIAEEFSEEMLALNFATVSTAQGAARQSNRAHMFCEPPIALRREWGEDLNTEREKYWLERLKSSNALRIVFVCGKDHLISFQSMLEESGYKATVTSQIWGAGWAFVQ